MNRISEERLFEFDKTFDLEGEDCEDCGARFCLESGRLGLSQARALGPRTRAAYATPRRVNAVESAAPT